MYEKATVSSIHYDCAGRGRRPTVAAVRWSEGWWTVRPPSVSSERWVDEHGDTLYRYALSRLSGDAHAAEDAVQETFLAAVKARKTFRGDSAERTWLIGILRHKIVDYIRKESRMCPQGDLSPEDSPEDHLFDPAGKWRSGLQSWQSRPDQVLEQSEFQEVLRGCIENLPKTAAAAFSLREMENQSTEEICKVLNVSATNLWVLLHRARLRLQSCLHINWFGNAATGDDAC